MLIRRGMIVDLCLIIGGIFFHTALGLRDTQQKSSRVDIWMKEFSREAPVIYTICGPHSSVPDDLKVL